MDPDQNEHQLEEVTYKAPDIRADTDTALKPESVNGKTPFFLYLISTVANLLSFATGVSIGWTTPVIPKLMKNDTDNPLGYPISHAQVSWVAALLALGAAAGPLVAGKVADKMGRKMILLVIACIYLISFLITTFGENIFLYYIARSLTGISVGGTYAVLPMFMAEISENHNRGAIICSISIFVALGMNAALIVGPYLTVQNFCLVSLAPVLMFLVSFLILSPESPAFLASVNDETGVRDVLFKLRNKSPSEIRLEAAAIVESARRVGRSRPGMRELFRSKTACRALIIASGLIIFQQSSGMGAIFVFLPAIFESGGGQLSPEVSTMLVGTSQVVGTVLAVVVVDRSGRRILLLASSLGMTVTLTALGLYFYLRERHAQLEWCSWLPVLSLIVFILSFSVGFGPIPWAIMAEVFSPDLRAKAASIVSFLCFMTVFFVTVIFPSLTLYLGMAKCFLLFSFVSAAATAFIYWILPETKGKSIQEIQQLLGNIAT